MSPTAAPAWFSNCVIECVQLLVVLSLPNTPPAETVTATALSWVDVLWHAGPRWDAATDERRLRAAVRALAGRAERWPAPRALLQHLPPRPEAPKLPEPPLNPNPEALAQLRALSAGLRIRPAHRPPDANAIAARLRQEDT